ncbi:UDP-2,3-diacylglucosamine diphosphatase [Acuticoccus sp. MNP-M23]|uniref:UDP-2,3-diacylglucosamine diphosphatase n=1 Tax=Acuticoccus sp. MNP-M23 TaxID=3072793 RepID=UPI002814A07B|nr:UDP-2,3-diacylglucosamine diphosphatase [Acuticoccus sp. MNP-M23]WMS41147.1 UDP-2,3-diacylglucosamine diphosphatase [Acuticoccus sp. MNP-M23]
MARSQSGGGDVRKYRTLFISDIHLGSKGCQAELLLDFLRYHEAETIYLVGDIIDGWRLKKNWYWPQSHNDVVQKILRQGRKGARIVYLPGNHDEFLREYLGTHFGGVEVTDSIIHETAAGKKLLVIHGDQFDVVVRHARWLAFLGDWAYVTTLAANTWVNRFRRRLGLTYWSLSAWAKLKVKNAVSFIGQFETALASEAKRRGADGVVCGHIHHPVIRDMLGVEYINTGDWVESCSAVAENEKGELILIKWTKMRRSEDVMELSPSSVRAA